MKRPERTYKRRQRQTPESPLDFVCPECGKAKNDPDRDCEATAWHAEFALPPQIASFTPSSGPVGTSVTIVGRRFTARTKVAFGDVQASVVIVNSATQVTATVPTDAKTGHIEITTPRGIAISKSIFTVTP